jgi:signal transduction histidine kinase
LNNIIDNAVYFANKRHQLDGTAPEVTVMASADDDNIRINIIDNGIGIPRHLLKIDGKTGWPAIFSINRSTRKEGSGLGDAYVRHVLTAYHGTITVDSLSIEIEKETATIGYGIETEVEKAAKANPELRQMLAKVYQYLIDISGLCKSLSKKIKTKRAGKQDYLDALIRYRDVLAYTKRYSQFSQKKPQYKLLAEFLADRFGNNAAPLRFYNGMSPNFDFQAAMDLCMKEYPFLLELIRKLSTGERFSAGTTMSLRFPRAHIPCASLPAIEQGPQRLSDASQ